ncbi:hypothetical protein O181_026373 [Austropuccinia psidii MF-1]|uniref:F5/8 type C domain-containing protein n=1 Tax=Austropuccinia psidii MF-1 TaxID=1389203 RepID=A0A9Q3CPN1_9BASI|nr:hypothetical protein [Austropuccinia psidii MF-1]
MNFFQLLGIFASWFSVANARIALTAQPFQISGGATNNIKLSWDFNIQPNSTGFTIKRKLDASDYVVLGHAPGGSYDDYDTPSGSLTYQVTSDGSGEVSNEVNLSSSLTESQDFSTFDNTNDATFLVKSKIKQGNQYFSYEVQNEKGVKQIVEKTSQDGVAFSKERVLLTREQICADSPDGFCKLEAVTFLQHPQTSEVVMWGHWENNRDYSLGRVAVAFGQPGGKWTFGGSFRPLGHDSRDMSVFVDDDGASYLTSSTRTNSDMNIYALSGDWHNVSSLVTTVLQGQRREAPAMLRHDNFYYLFTSLASGWYPSAGQYISAQNLTGPWSSGRYIGNIAGFGAQSGPVTKLGSTWVMRANRWARNWKTAEPSNRQIILPISLSNGYASYHFYKTIRYLDDEKQGGVFGVQSGRIISTGKNSVASNISTISGAGISNPINDGVQNDPNNLYVPAKVPFTYEIDLGSTHTFSQVDLTTKLVGGSETAYQFTIEARATQDASYKTLVDLRKNTAPGFVTSSVVETQGYQYVRLNVMAIVNVLTGKEEDWQKGVAEWTIYGAPNQSQEKITSNM